MILDFNQSIDNKSVNSNFHSKPDNSLNINNYSQLRFINYTQKYCIGIIDIINSTKETSKIKDSGNLRKYYSLFLNTMSSIITNFNGKVVKNVGDGLFYYFPRTLDITDESSFHDVLECGLTMIASNTLLNIKSSEEELPPINYRICMDYGEVEIAISATSNEVDLFGSVVNDCSKINRFASSNGFIIGKRLYEILSRLSIIKDYTINKINGEYNESNKTFDILYSINTFNEDRGKKTKFRYKEEPNQDSEIHDKAFNIMIIDDDEDILYIFQTLLKREGYNTKVFSNPIESLKHYAEINPYFYNLVIIDIRMPDLNGFQLYYRLKAINPHVNILFVSALDIVQELLDVIPGIQAHEIMRKPVESDDFILKIKSIISGHIENKISNSFHI